MSASRKKGIAPRVLRILSDDFGSDEYSDDSDFSPNGAGKGPRATALKRNTSETSAESVPYAEDFESEAEVLASTVDLQSTMDSVASPPVRKATAPRPGVRPLDLSSLEQPLRRMESAPVDSKGRSRSLYLRRRPTSQRSTGSEETLHSHQSHASDAAGSTPRQQLQLLDKGLFGGHSPWSRRSPPVGRRRGSGSSSSPKDRAEGEGGRSLRRRPRRWKLGNKLGEGSFGSVYVGIDEDTGSLMAVKVLRLPEELRDETRTRLSTLASPDPLGLGAEEKDACESLKSSGSHLSNSGSSENAASVDGIKSLVNEVELMKGLDHPHVVRYLGAELDWEARSVYIFQEWVPGGSVEALLRKFGPLSAAVCRRYTRQVLSGLQYLHDNAIIHRDIKGANILVDDAGRVRLSDFGCSKRESVAKKDLKIRTSVTGKSLRGTPFFMAPEVLGRQSYGRRADVWSVGGLTLQMATGHPPWSGLGLKTIPALYFHVCNTAEPPPMPEELPPAMEDFLLRCFERDALQRPTAAELLEHPWMDSAYDDLAAEDRLRARTAPPRRRERRRGPSDGAAEELTPTASNVKHRLRRWQSAGTPTARPSPSPEALNSPNPSPGHNPSPSLSPRAPLPGWAEEARRRRSPRSRAASPKRAARGENPFGGRSRANSPKRGAPGENAFGGRQRAAQDGAAPEAAQAKGEQEVRVFAEAVDECGGRRGRERPFEVHTVQSKLDP